MNYPITFSLLFFLALGSLRCTASEKMRSADIPKVADDGGALYEGLSCDDTLSLKQEEPFRQVSWMMTDADISTAEYRVPMAQGIGQWSPWKSAEITFSEGTSYNARILLPEPTTTIEIRGGQNLHRAAFSFSPRIVARVPAKTKSLSLPEELTNHCVNAESAFHPLPSDLVVERRDWGAIDPDKICRDVSVPTRVSFHHTFIPGSDSEDVARGVRQIQAFHINERGWCDVGYHFLISETGEVFRGRSGANRPGAHVAGHNKGNIGIGFIGDFTTAPPTNAQMQSAARITGWIHEAYGIPLTRTAMRGHHEWPGQTTGCPGEFMNGEGGDRIAQILSLVGS